MDKNKLTLDEKLTLLTAKDSHYTVGYENRGIRSMGLFDGPCAVLKYDDAVSEADNQAFANAEQKSLPSTAFPTGSALASTWNPALLEQVGEVLGEECIERKVDMLLGPSVNIVRNPLCGRNFEYFSEDPLLAGTLAASYVKGLQSKGVSACIKHYTMNNQEQYRGQISSNVDERTLRDIYLKPFEIAQKKSHLWALMCSYNKINGIMASENKYLLTDILRKEWGFDGAVVSDWGAVSHRGRAMAAGLDLCFAFRSEAEEELHESLDSGLLSEKQVDESIDNILRLMKRTEKKAPIRTDAHQRHALAVRAASEAAVLLKNNGVLPLDAGKLRRVLVVGERARSPFFSGDGSSRNQCPAHLVTPLDAIKKALGDSVEVEFLGDDQIDTFGIDIGSMAGVAAGAASRADVVLFFVGQHFSANSEAVDRMSITLTPYYNYTMEALRGCCKNIITIANIGSVVDLQIMDQWSDALLVSWLGGEGMGEALADILLGKTCPSGRLPITFASRVEEYPSYRYYRNDPRSARHDEQKMVGYRYFDTEKVDPAYPFGFGLSYTEFTYSDLSVEITAEGADISFTLKNTGACDGAETAQLYVSQQRSFLPQPAQELRAFQKVFLKSGEQQRVRMQVPYEDFCTYNIMLRRPYTDGGVFTFRVGSSSRDIRLTADAVLESREDLTFKG